MPQGIDEPGILEIHAWGGGTRRTILDDVLDNSSWGEAENLPCSIHALSMHSHRYWSALASSISDKFGILLERSSHNTYQAHISCNACDSEGE